MYWPWPISFLTWSALLAVLKHCMHYRTNNRVSVDIAVAVASYVQWTHAPMHTPIVPIRTHMKVCSSVVHPSHHDIRVHHPTIGRETKAHPSRRTDVHCKRDRAVCSAEVPVEHVRISIPVVECRTEGVPTGEVTQNEGQQSQQTHQRPHRGVNSTQKTHAAISGRVCDVM